MTLVDRTLGGVAFKVAQLTRAQVEVATRGELLWVERMARQILACAYDASAVVLFASLPEVYALPAPLFQALYDTITAALRGQTQDAAPVIAGATTVRGYVAAACAADPLFAIGGLKFKIWTAGEHDAHCRQWLGERRDVRKLALLELTYNTNGTRKFASYDEVLALTDSDFDAHWNLAAGVNGGLLLSL